MTTPNRDNTEQTILAWHFTGETLRDGRPVPAPGVPLRHPDYRPLALCREGLHASLQPFDALEYAPGAMLHLVRCSARPGEIIHGNDGDKLVTRERTIVVSMDATPLLRHFARQQALSVLHHWPDPPDCVLDFLMGDDTARDAAGAAAWAAARDAARAAARAAEGAARAAAEAAEDAAWAAAWAAAGGAARADFNGLVYESFADWMEN